VQASDRSVHPNPNRSSNLWHVTLTYGLDLDWVSTNHRAKYLGRSQIISFDSYCTNTRTDTAH